MEPTARREATTVRVTAERVIRLREAGSVVSERLAAFLIERDRDAGIFVSHLPSRYEAPRVVPARATPSSSSHSRARTAAPRLTLLPLSRCARAQLRGVGGAQSSPHGFRQISVAVMLSNFCDTLGGSELSLLGEPDDLPTRR